MEATTGEILVVDDDQRLVGYLRSVLEEMGHRVTPAYSAEEALTLLVKNSFDVAFLDHVLPRKSGLDLLAEMKESWPTIEIVMITGSANVETAVAAMKAGATDFVQKPFTLELIRITTSQVMERQRLRKQNAGLRELSSGELHQRDLIFESESMKTLLGQAQAVAGTETTILITGETGVGKELVARTIHRLGTRRECPFVPVDCASVPEHLMESAFFGHEKGSFTGADRQKLGMVEVADTGTLFLDEIGEMSLALQVKLLRLLQEKTFRRVGGAGEHRVDVQVIAATNRDPEVMVREKTFRADLYYRLKVVRFTVPPLRERIEDILPLANYFLARSNRKCRKDLKGFSEDAIQALRGYHWPGNVRELENAIERAVVFSEGSIIRRADLSSVLGAQTESEGNGSDQSVAISVSLPQDLNLKEFRERAIKALEGGYAQRLLAVSGGNIAAAARMAGIARRSFYRLMERCEAEERVPDEGS